nr:MAG TPA: hypothetical protein [Caudoviricetes sp.]
MNYTKLVREYCKNNIGDDNISSKKLLEDIKHNKKEIFSKLEQYPAYFEDRLKFLLLYFRLEETWVEVINIK